MEWSGLKERSESAVDMVRITLFMEENMNKNEIILFETADNEVSLQVQIMKRAETYCIVMKKACIIESRQGKSGFALLIQPVLEDTFREIEERTEQQLRSETLAGS